MKFLIYLFFFMEKLERLKELKGLNVVKQSDFPDIIVTESSPSECSKLFRVDSKSRGSKKTSFFNFSNFFCVLVIAFFSSWVSQLNHIGAKILVLFILLILALVGFWLYQHATNSGIVSESVLAVKGLGLQLFAETRKGNMVNMRFIEREKIKEILIVEGFTALKVIVYPAIELLASSSSGSSKKSGNMALPFQHIQVPLAVSVDVCQGLRAALAL